MSYEDSEACKLVATCCACCGRPLVDAISVELGMGPICRKKHGYDEGPAEHRPRANKLVYWIAAKQSGDEVAKWVVELRDLGFVKLADIIIDRLDNVLRILKETHGKEVVYLVRAPLRRDVFDAWHQLPGAYWDRKRKVRVVPARSYVQLWALLDRFFSGMKVVGEPRPVSPATDKRDPATGLPLDAEGRIVLDGPIVNPGVPPPVEIRIEQSGDSYLVFPPYRDDLVSAWSREVAGAYWDGVNRCRRVPLTSRNALWAFLKRHFAGAVLVTAARQRTVIG